MPDFQVITGKPAPTAGLLLRVGQPPCRYLRLTHVFSDCAFVMWVGEPEQARYARRPTPMSLSELRALAAQTDAAWGRRPLPAALANEPAPGTDRAVQLEAAWSLVKPLVDAFKSKTNLARQNFTALVRQHATATETSQTTLLRMLLRYYYFGGTRLALLPMPPGVKPGSGSYPSSTDASRPQLKRRGRQPALSNELGRNEFIVQPEDIEDMVISFRRQLAKGPAVMTTAHEDYLAGAFRLRHPELYAKYVANQTPEPVTARQFRYYLDRFLKLTDELARNLRPHQRNPGYLGSVRAAGPGEVYEIDATGGRLHLIATTNPPVIVGKPTIYLLIDRWSRFVVSAYLSLRPPSYEEVRHTLLVAFTSRQARFNRLGVNITDERWPVGRMPAVICPDRGSDFMSDSMEESVVNNLRIELTPLPPLCPDGKAIVERLIREIKRRMAASGMKGTYADRPMDPRAKRAARKAEAGAVHTLSEAYRLLVQIVEDHNNRPHSSLRRRRVLTVSGIPPTPREAYLWGLKNITGIRSAPLSEDDYYRLLLSRDKASMANGVLTYKRRPYLAANEAAAGLAQRSTGRAKAIDVRLDKTLPTELLVPSDQGIWAKFVMTAGAANEIAGLSLDEEQAFADQTALLWARADHEGRVARVTAKNEKRPSTRKAATTAAKLAKKEQIAARNQETAQMKEQLLGRPLATSSESSQQEVAINASDWTRLEEEERLRNLELIRRHRNKR